MGKISAKFVGSVRSWQEASSRYCVLRKGMVRAWSCGEMVFEER